MDDPLVGLTIWQSVQQKKPPNRAKGAERLAPNDGRSIVNGEKREKTDKAFSAKKKEGKRSARSKREAGRSREGEEEENCVPCLPGLDNGVDKALDTMQGKRQEGERGAAEEKKEEEEEESELTERSVAVAEGQRSPPLKQPSQLDTTHLCSPVPQPQNFWLMRLFQSKLFNMSIAVRYLFHSKEADVQAYLGNKLFVSACGECMCSTCAVQ